MIKCRVIKNFTLGEFDKINVTYRKNASNEGKLYVDDEFTCDEKMARYLTGENEKGNVVVKVIEVIPNK